MRKNYTPITQLLKKNLGSLGLFLACIGGALPSGLNAQVTYSFTSAGVTGQNGPTQAQINTAYASTNLNGLVTVAGGIQSFTVPTTGPYRIRAVGGQGGYSGGYGAMISGDYTLTAGTVLKIMVGQAGTTGTNGALYHAGGGGGGSYVTTPANVPYVVAGGGGGNGDAYGPSPLPCCLSGMQGTTSTSGNANPTNGGASSGGTNGGGGGCGGGAAGAGAGITGNGSQCSSAGAALSFVNGGTGGTPYMSTTGPTYSGAYGGFGGGGGQYDSGTGMRGGGGGGYSGGGGGDTPSFFESNASAGGGGSYNSGVNQTNTVSTTGGDGKVFVIQLCDVNITTNAANPAVPSICSGQSLTLTTSAVSNYTWSNGNTTSTSIVVAPSTTTTYSIVGQSTLGCSNAAAVTVIVNAGTPTINVTSSTLTTCSGNTVALTATGALTYTYTNAGVTNGVAFTPPIGTTQYSVNGTNGCGTTSAAITITIVALPVTAATTSTLLCAGSPATLTGNGAATYSWVPGTGTQSTYVVNPVQNTTYTVLGKTGNCFNTATVSIHTNPLPTMTVTANTPSVCSGGIVNLTVNGNATSYTWTPGGQTGTSISASPVNSGAYTATGKNGNGCISSAFLVIVVSPTPVVNIIASSSEICTGETVTLTAIGAVTYSWTGGPSTAAFVVTPAAAANYMVTGFTSAGCAGTASKGINIFEPVITVSSNTTICIGANVTVSSDGADSYSWNTGATSQAITVAPTASTSYTVTGMVTNQNNLTCSATAVVEVSVNPLPTLSATAEPTIICKGKSSVLTAGGAGAAGTYTWSGSNGNNLTATVSPAADQLYTLTGKTAEGCRSTTTVQVSVSPCTGINSIAANNNSILVYPNPSNGEFTISAEQAITLTLVNEVGQLVKVINLTAASHEEKVSNLANGIYFITGANENGSVKQKIVIAH